MHTCRRLRVVGRAARCGPDCQMWAAARIRICRYQQTRACVRIRLSVVGKAANGGPDCEMWGGLPLVGHEYAGSCGLTLACIRATGCEWWAVLRDVVQAAICGTRICNSASTRTCICIRDCKLWPGCELWPGCQTWPGCELWPGCQTWPGCRMWAGLPPANRCDVGVGFRSTAG